MLILLDIDDCGKNPCNNHGSCADGIESFYCTCDEGYKGNECEIGNNWLNILFCKISTKMCL